MDRGYDQYTPAELEAAADRMLGLTTGRRGPKTRKEKEAGILTPRQWKTVDEKEKYGYFGDMSNFDPVAVDIHIPEDYYARVIG